MDDIEMQVRPHLRLSQSIGPSQTTNILIDIVPIDKCVVCQELLTLAAVLPAC